MIEHPTLTPAQYTAAWNTISVSGTRLPSLQSAANHKSHVFGADHPSTVATLDMLAREAQAVADAARSLAGSELAAGVPVRFTDGSGEGVISETGGVAVLVEGDERWARPAALVRIVGVEAM